MTVTKVDFDPDKKSIKEIFEGSIQMSIPRYQRTYSWPKDKVEEFYDDFIVDSEKAEDNLSYLGTILFSKDSDGNLEVIDGQQRLVTITIFFAAIRDLAWYFIDTDRSKSFSDSLHRLIIPELTLGNSILDESRDTVKLRVGADIENIFEKIIYHKTRDALSITPRKTSEKNVLSAYSLFYTRIKTLIDLPKISSDDQLKLLVRIVQKILGIEYIDIRVVDKEIAYNLFESHNAKGIALAKTDLIKNYYFGRIKGSDDEKNRMMDEWDALLENLDLKTKSMLPDRFFNYMVESYEGNFSSSFLYRKIKPYIENPSLFRKMLQSNIEYMIELKSALTGEKSVDEALLGISKMKINQCFIFLLSLRRNKDYFNQKSYQDIVKVVENFSYIYSAVSKQPTNALEKVYARQAKKIQEAVKLLGKPSSLDSVEKERLGGRTLRALRDELVAITPPFSVFASGLSELSYENIPQRALIRYTFEKIERHHSKGLVDLGGQFTLDHIVPQSKSKGNNKFHSLGNLVPLSSTDNSSLGSSDPHEKLKIYKDNSNLYTIRGLIETLEAQQFFGPEDIEQRTQNLATYAFEHVFKIDQ